VSTFTFYGLCDRGKLPHARVSLPTAQVNYLPASGVRIVMVTVVCVSDSQNWRMLSPPLTRAEEMIPVVQAAAL
jgi:hypothetical protein